MWIVYISKNIELHKNIKNMVPLEKKETTEVISFGFSRSDKEKFISPKKTFIDFKDSIDQKENIV